MSLNYETMIRMSKEDLFVAIHQRSNASPWKPYLSEIIGDEAKIASLASSRPELEKTYKKFTSLYGYIHTHYKNGINSTDWEAMKSYVSNELMIPTYTCCMGSDIRHSNCFCGTCTCFAPGCEVVMEGGSVRKRVEDILPGDVVASGARVVCKVVNTIPEGVAHLVRLGPSLLITPTHPVRRLPNNQWVFPKDQDVVLHEPCRVVYNFVLDKDHILNIDGFQCATLAHGFEGPVIGHPYFGTDAILRDLRQEPGWHAGIVHYERICIDRDPETGLVCRIRRSPPS